MNLTPEQIEWRSRHLQSIREMDDETLLFAYVWGYQNPNLDPYDPAARAILESRLLTRIFEATKELATLTEMSRVEVARLAASSDKVERLTGQLKTFTIWLIAFAGIQIAIAAVQTWKMFQPERPVQVVVQPALPNPPQPQH